MRPLAAAGRRGTEAPRRSKSYSSSYGIFPLYSWVLVGIALLA
jgi:hypothetical protein